jgi:hypothetical protein
MRGTSFCPNCGASTTELTEICPNCGARVAGKVAEKAGATWMPLTAGILDLVAGVPALIISILVATGLGALGWFSDIVGFAALIGAIATPLIIFAIIAIVGGVFAIRKRIWGLALAGSIFALFCAWIFGIPAIVFTIMGRRHFK